VFFTFLPLSTASQQVSYPAGECIVPQTELFRKDPLPNTDKDGNSEESRTRFCNEAVPMAMRILQQWYYGTAGPYDVWCIDEEQVRIWLCGAKPTVTTTGRKRQVGDDAPPSVAATAVPVPAPGMSWGWGVGLDAFLAKAAIPVPGAGTGTGDEGTGDADTLLGHARLRACFEKIASLPSAGSDHCDAPLFHDPTGRQGLPCTAWDNFCDIEGLRDQAACPVFDGVRFLHPDSSSEINDLGLVGGKVGRWVGGRAIMLTCCSSACTY
jgi:hypothetical protein